MNVIYTMLYDIYAIILFLNSVNPRLIVDDDDDDDDDDADDDNTFHISSDASYITLPKSLLSTKITF